MVDEPCRRIVLPVYLLPLGERLSRLVAGLASAAADGVVHVAAGGVRAEPAIRSLVVPFETLKKLTLSVIAKVVWLEQESIERWGWHSWALFPI